MSHSYQLQWQPTLVLGLECGGDDYSAMPCVLLRQLIRERNLKVPSLKACFLLIHFTLLKC